MLISTPTPRAPTPTLFARERERERAPLRSDRNAPPTLVVLPARPRVPYQERYRDFSPKVLFHPTASRPNKPILRRSIPMRVPNRITRTRESHNLLMRYRPVILKTLTPGCPRDFRGRNANLYYIPHLRTTAAAAAATRCSVRRRLSCLTRCIRAYRCHNIFIRFFSFFF